MRNITLRIAPYIVITLLMAACGPATESSKDDNGNSTAQKETKKPMTDSNLLEGKVSLKIAEKTFEMDKFLKNKTEVTLVDDKFIVRITSPDDDQHITITFTGPDVYGDRPMTFSLTPGKEENTATLMLMGFVNKGEKLNTLRLDKGTLALEKMDTESLGFSVTFEGSGQSITLSNAGNAENVDRVSGSIDLTFDNKVDMRKN